MSVPLGWYASGHLCWTATVHMAAVEVHGQHRAAAAAASRLTGCAVAVSSGFSCLLSV